MYLIYNIDPTHLLFNESKKVKCLLYKGPPHTTDHHTQLIAIGITV
jgi:hypothetical protein